MSAPPLQAVEGARLELVPDTTPATIGIVRAPSSDLLVTGYNQVGLASAFGVLGVLVASRS